MSRSVTLVCGPPCGGKTTWVHEQADPTDVVLDYDDLARRLGSAQAHRHRDEQIQQTAEALMHSEMHRLTQQLDVTAWVIRCAPQPHARTRYARMAQATRVLLLIPPMPVALHRARTRPPGTARAIRSWYYKYRPQPGEEVITSGVDQ